MLVNIKHIIIPVAVGTKNDIKVHLILLVSFFMVRQVVLQGQCIKEKSITQIAVFKFHPFSTNNL